MAIQTVKTGAAVNDGTGDDARTAFTKINQNFTDNANAASRLVGTATGNVMEVGAFGLGENAVRVTNDTLLSALRKGFITIGTQPAIVYGQNYGPAYNGILRLPTSGQSEISVSRIGGDTSTTIGQNTDRIIVRTTANTSVDANGFIKNASPIVELFADKIELNDEAELQPITFEKLGVGDYLVKGSLGFAQEGWYIEMPKDANGNVLVAVIYEQLANNDISVKTYAKKLDEETGDVVANTAKPRDIPSTRWIDLRLQALPQSDIEPFATEENTVTTNAE
nr:phage tail protein [Moraxella sp. CTOTU47579]